MRAKVIGCFEEFFGNIFKNIFKSFQIISHLMKPRPVMDLGSSRQMICGASSRSFASCAQLDRIHAPKEVLLERFSKLLSPPFDHSFLVLLAQ